MFIQFNSTILQISKHVQKSKVSRSMVECLNAYGKHFIDPSTSWTWTNWTIMDNSSFCILNLNWTGIIHPSIFWTWNVRDNLSTQQFDRRLCFHQIWSVNDAWLAQKERLHCSNGLFILWSVDTFDAETHSHFLKPQKRRQRKAVFPVSLCVGSPKAEIRKSLNNKSVSLIATLNRTASY